MLRHKSLDIREIELHPLTLNSPLTSIPHHPLLDALPLLTSSPIRKNDCPSPLQHDLIIQALSLDSLHFRLRPLTGKSTIFWSKERTMKNQNHRNCLSINVNCLLTSIYKCSLLLLFRSELSSGWRLSWRPTLDLVVPGAAGWSRPVGIVQGIAS